MRMSNNIQDNVFEKIISKYLNSEQKEQLGGYRKDSKQQPKPIRQEIGFDRIHEDIIRLQDKTKVSPQQTDKSSIRENKTK